MSVLLLIVLFCGGPTTVAFGDSITVGYGARTQAAMWANQVGAVDNRAVAGSTVREQVEEQIRVYEGGARRAWWFSCANDILQGTPSEEYRRALLEGVTILQSRGLAVSLGTCLRFRIIRPEWSALHDAYNDAIRSVASETGARLVDIDAVYVPAEHEATFLPYHPNDAGHALIARTFMSTSYYFPMMMMGGS